MTFSHSELLYIFQSLPKYNLINILTYEALIVWEHVEHKAHEARGTWDTRARFPRWNSPCRGDRVIQLKSFKKVRQRAELNWASQLQPPVPTDLLNCNVKNWVKRLSPVKITPLGVVTVRQYLPLYWVRKAPKVNGKKSSHASRFYRWFLEIL